MKAWILILTAPNCITAFSSLSFEFLPLNLWEGAGHNSQLANLIFLERHNSGCLMWFEHSISKKEEYAFTRWIEQNMWPE